MPRTLRATLLALAAALAAGVTLAQQPPQDPHKNLPPAVNAPATARLMRVFER